MTDPSVDTAERWSDARLGGLVALVAVVMIVVLVPLGMPVPQVDDAWFKGPAAELAMNGRLASPGITGFFPRIHQIFACYPPLPQILLAVWYRLFGVSLGSSLVWSLSTHTAFAIAATLVTSRVLSTWPARAANLASLVTGLVWLAHLRLLDRQEELGLVWVWAGILILPTRGAWRSGIGWGVLVGLAGLCSPWSGVLSALFVTVSAAFRVRASPRDTILGLGLSGGVAAAFPAAWIATIEHLHPGVFREQFLGAMSYAARDAPYPATLGSLANTFGASLGYQAWLLPAVTVALLSAPIALRAWRPQGRDGNDARIVVVSLGITACLGLFAALALRPSAYTYVWASLDLLAPCLGLALARYLVADGVGMALVLLGVTWIGPAVALGRGLLQAPNERPEPVFERLYEVVPPGAPVAVSAQYWTAFQGRNPWRDALFLEHRDARLLDGCDWMVLAAGEGSNLPPFIADFELVEQVPTGAAVHQTYAYGLWRRRAR